MNPEPSATSLVQFNDDVVRRALQATARCVERFGFHKVSMEHIAAESGISRATLYRRFGNRETILIALIQELAQPFVADSQRAAARATTFRERLELSTLYAVREILKYPALKAFFEMDALPHSQNLIRPVYRQLMEANLVPTLDAARAKGELREGLETEDLIEWLMRNFLLLVADGPWQEEALMRRIRHYILPVLIVDPAPLAGAKPPAAEPAVAKQLRDLERRVAELQQAVGSLRQELYPAPPK